MKLCKYRKLNTWVCTRNKYKSDKYLCYNKVCILADADSWANGTVNRDVL